MTSVDDVTVVTVNYRTLQHTRRCIETLLSLYSEVKLIIVDNGSADESLKHLSSLAARNKQVVLLANDRNIFHGPALNQALLTVRSRFAFLLDSDCEVTGGGFLERMLGTFERDPGLYAIGKLGWTDRFGYGPITRHQHMTGYVHPFAAMFDVDKYKRLPPAVHHGAPLYRNMWGARRAGYHLAHDYIENDITHVGKVTARSHGYGYDRRLEWQYRLHRVENALWRGGAAVLNRRLVPPVLLPGRSGGTGGP